MHTPTSIAQEVDGDAREVGGGIVIEGNIEVERRNNDDGDGMVELRENERNDTPTPSINNHSYSFSSPTNSWQTPTENSVFSPIFLNSKFSNSTPSKPTFLNSNSTFPQSIFSNLSNQTLGFPHQSTQALGSSSKDISQGDTTPIENIASPIPMKKKKYRSLNEIYEITDPMEALMVDLDEENEYTQNH